MIVNLPVDLDQFVKNLVVQGRFESEEAAIAESVRLLVTREELHAEVAKGIRQLDDGDWFDEEIVLSELTEAQKSELDQRIAAYKSDPNNVLTWEEVELRLRQTK